MKIKAQTTVAATPGEILAYITTEDFYRELQATLKKVTAVELLEVERLDDGRLRRRARFTAPAELPRFLRKFQKKAPDEVYWDDIGFIDESQGRMSFSIHPDVPDHWDQFYENTGTLTLTQDAEGFTQLVFFIEFSINAPALSFLIERALRSEVDDIISSQANIIRQYFRSRSS